MDKKDLEKENEELKKKLTLAQNWIKRDIEWEKLLIAKERAVETWEKERLIHYKENARQIIVWSIKNFFWDLLFAQTPEYVLENIISAEVFFYNQRYLKFTDWLGVITWYNKAVDYLIEENITKLFRSYVRKNWPKTLKVNDLNEKTLYSVVDKGYTIWVWRLYSILKTIKESNDLYDYTKAFSDFLNEYEYIKDILLSDDFCFLMSELVKSELFWEKRHKWKITFKESKFARKILIWDLQDKKCIIYMLVEMWAINV